jgi:hypothetical protein
MGTEALVDVLGKQRPLRGVTMDDLPTRRRFLQGFASAMAGVHVIKMPPPLCERIYASVARDGRPYYSDPQRLGQFVSPAELGEGREHYHGHLVIGSCRWLGGLRADVVDELIGKNRLSLELGDLNRAAVLDLMDQFCLHEGLDRNEPAIAYAVDRYVSSGYFLNLRRGLAQDIDFPPEKPDELKTSRLLHVPLFFDSVDLASQPPVIIRPAMWRFAKPLNPSARFDFHFFTNVRNLYRSDWQHINGFEPEFSRKPYIPGGRSHVTTFVPAGVEDGSIMERVTNREQAYAYHELFQPVRFKRCLRTRLLLLARFRAGWINQVNVAFEPPHGPTIPLVMDINLRSQPFDCWVDHHVGLRELLEQYTAERA